MRTALRTLAFAAVTLLVASPAAAQQITGTWIADIERRVQNDNGNVSAGEKSRVRITLTQKGDSVFGTLASVSPPGSQAPATPPRELRGTIAGNKAVISMDVVATRVMNGEVEEVKATVTYDVVINGDLLEGTMSTRAGDMAMPGLPFTATREKPGE